MSLNGLLFEVAMIPLSGGDPAAIPKFTSLGNALATWFLANVQALPGLMTGAAGAVSGLGAISITGSGNDLGTHLANAVIPTPSALDYAKWRIIGNALVSHIPSHAFITPISWTYPFPAGGTCAGTPGTVGFTSLVPSPLLSTAMGLTDPAGMAAMDGTNGVFQSILKVIKNNATVAAPQFSCAVSGPLAGVGVIT